VVLPVAAVPEYLFGFVVLEPAGGADREGEFRAEVEGRVGGLQRAQPEDQRAVLDAEVEAERGVGRVGVWLREWGAEVRGRDGAGGPAWIGGR
jgi:hypothetical protein